MDLLYVFCFVILVYVHHYCFNFFEHLTRSDLYFALLPVLCL